MTNSPSPFRQCLQAISAGDGATLQRVVMEHPELQGEGLDHLVGQAAEAGSIDLLNVLLELQVGAEMFLDSAMVNAADNGHLDLVNWLLSRHVPVNYIDGGLPYSPALYFAIQGQHLEIVTLLIEQGATVPDCVRKQATGDIKEYLDSLKLKSDLELRRERNLLGAMSAAKRPGEIVYLSELVANQDGDEARLKYADWLDAQQDPRGAFLRKLVTAKQTMQWRDLPSREMHPDDWIAMVGYELIASMIRQGYPEPSTSILRLAKPALSLKQTQLR